MSQQEPTRLKVLNGVMVSSVRKLFFRSLLAQPTPVVENCR